MTKPKKAARLQRQTSEKLQQTRSITIIPIHRESIVNTGHNITVRRPSETVITGQTTIIRRPSGTMALGRCVPSGNGTTTNQNRSWHDHLPPQTDQWMAKFCVEPIGGLDCHTCCLGCLFPFALYGKVNWRLKRKSLGEDVFAFKPSHGCNGPCWAYCACSMIGVGCWHGVLSGKFS
jgi:hypothetical protein